MGWVGARVFGENSVDQRACAGCVGRVREQFGMDVHGSVGVADPKDSEQCRYVGAQPREIGPRHLRSRFRWVHPQTVWGSVGWTAPAQRRRRGTEPTAAISNYHGGA